MTFGILKRDMRLKLERELNICNVEMVKRIKYKQAQFDITSHYVQTKRIIMFQFPDRNMNVFQEKEITANGVDKTTGRTVCSIKSLMVNKS